MIVTSEIVKDGLPTIWSVEDLIGKAEAIISKTPSLFQDPATGELKSSRPSESELNVRLIRDYVVRGFIPRPGRLGREARFGFTHLLHLLAVRHLLRNKKWSLSAIRELLTDVAPDEILSSFLGPIRDRLESERNKIDLYAKEEASKDSASPQRELNSAQLLIEKFRQSSRDASGRATASRPPVALYARTGSTGSLQARLASSRTTKVHLELAPGCDFQIEAERLASLTEEDVKRLAETLFRRLHEEIG